MQCKCARPQAEQKILEGVFLQFAVLQFTVFKSIPEIKIFV